MKLSSQSSPNLLLMHEMKIFYFSRIQIAELLI